MQRVLPIAVLAIAAAPAAFAQRTITSFDLSGTTVWYADSIRASGASLSPALRVDWSRATLNASADISGLGSNNVSTQGTIVPSIFTPSYGAFSGELTAIAGGSTHQDGNHTGELLATARGYLIGAAQGGWVGGGLGRTWDGSVWRGVRQVELGGWFQQQGTTTLATITPVVVADTIRYTDVQAALRYPTPSYELGVSAGLRGGASGPFVGGTSRVWGSVSVVKWLGNRLAFVGAAGTYPVDFTQGFPGGRFASVSLRIASSQSRVPERGVEASASAVDAGPSFEMRSVGGNRRTFRVIAPAARSVEITGDFTAWQPVALVRGPDGAWTTTRVIPPGTYQMNLRVDGTPWIAPPGLVSTRDEFGGITGILTIQ
jgi:hypothetical protein